MRKIFIVIMVGIVISMTGCYHRLCPTYTSTPSKGDKTKLVKNIQLETSSPEKENM